MPKARKSGKQQNRQPSTNPPKREFHQSRELSPVARIIALAIGDILCFLIFVSLGGEQHGEGFNLFNSFWLALPFVAGWFLVSPFIGAFRTDVATGPRRMLMCTALSWLASWPVTMGLRWLLVERVTVPPVPLANFFTFALVTLVTNMGLLLLWRWPFSLNNDLRKRGI